MAEIRAVRAKYVKATEVAYMTPNKDVFIDKTAGNGYLVLQVDKDERWRVKPFLEQLLSKPKWNERTLEVTVQTWYKRRTLKMNNLMWALLDIMSMEVYGEHGWSEVLYQDMLDRHAPGIISKFSGKRQPKTSSNFNAKEMSVFIDDIFRELAEVGVSLENAQSIASFWIDWYTWRGEQKSDPNLDQYESLEDYRQKVLYCECCLKFLRPDEGSVDHIITRGAGGPDEPWNLMRLCDQHHVGTMEGTTATGFESEASKHHSGYDALMKEFRHIGWRVRQAEEKMAERRQGVTDEQSED